MHGPFNISEKTVWNWVNQRKRTGSLKPKEVVRESPKLKSELLLQYVNDHPEAYLREIGAHFECAMSAVHKKLKKLGITYKKKS
ncbi:hypothetical protein FACS1894122_09470 [Alphaproteobacteria bacterium]|nr:hypothetical protein FACS1894122_09470 [Alphaproteobacteria bacterium]